MADESVNKEAHHHPQCSNDQRPSTTALLDNDKTTKGARDVDGSEDNLSDIAVVEASRLEDGGTVVEEEVGTGELLAGLQQDTEHEAVQHARTGENLVPLGIGALLHLLDLLADLFDFDIDAGGVRVDTSKTRDGLASLFLTPVEESETGALRQEQDTATKDESPGEAETVGNAPRCRVGNAVGAEVDHVGDPDTEGDEELIHGHDHAADQGRGRLRLVHGYRNRKSTDAQTVDEAADSKLCPARAGRDLDDNSHAGEECRGRDCQPTSDHIAQLAGDQASEETPDGEKTDDGALPGGGEEALAVRAELTETLEEVVHEEEAGDLATDVAEHEAADRSDEAEEAGGEGDALLLLDSGHRGPAGRVDDIALRVDGRLPRGGNGWVS